MKANKNLLIGLGIVGASFHTEISDAQKQDADLMKYNSISPSAVALIKLKSYTQIPYAKEAAGLLVNDTLGKDLRKGGRDFFKYLIHFENRYRTVDDLLAKVSPKNILEFSSGYSFRGLSLCMNQTVNFIDTDLPDVVETKEKMVHTLLADSAGKMKGHLQLLPLNVLNETDFNDAVSKFPDGPVTLINEGLLVYFDTEEKKKLCSIIHGILEKRGGYWITADIYIKSNEPRSDNPTISAFRNEHHLDENRFEDYESAEKFFRGFGFEIVYRESLAIEQLSCLRLLSVEKRNGVIDKLKNSPHSRETWCLRIASK